MSQNAATDRELLGEYVRRQSAEAFAQLYERYAPLVYSTALRILDDRSAADDATQAAFIVFSKRAANLPEKTLLAGWFFMTAQHCAQQIKRSEARRARHEWRAVEMSRSSDTSGAWKEIRPELDSALAALPSPQREALILRYFQGLSISEAAATLGCPEKTLDARLTRGLARLRERFGQRGAALTAVTLATLLSERAVHAAPAELASATMAVCMGKAAASAVASSSAQGVLTAMTIAKVKTAVCVALIAAAVCVPAAYTTVVKNSPAQAHSTQPSAAPAVIAQPIPVAVFSHEFDQVRDGEWSPNEFVRLGEGGGTLTAIVSKPFAGGGPDWKPEHYVELCGRDAEGQRATIFSVPDKLQIHLRLRSEKPGKCYFVQQPTECVSLEVGFGSEMLDIGPEWRDIVIKGSELVPYRRPHVHTPDLVPGMKISGFAVYGFGAGKFYLDSVKFTTTAEKETDW